MQLAKKLLALKGSINPKNLNMKRTLSNLVG